MAERIMRILQVSTMDVGGGAEKIAWNLFQSYRARGYNSWLAVGYKRSNDPDVFVILNHEVETGWYRFWWEAHSWLQSLDGRVRGAWRLSHLSLRLAESRRAFDRYRGVEDFRFPGTWGLLRMTQQPPDILHCHNLHGGYFDLRVLPLLSRQVPMILTLHDAWLLSGHCAHSFECNNWKSGCGACPDLTIYPAIQRDATRFNWRRKQRIYKQSRLFVATPSRWLMEKVDESMLADAIVENRVIPNGVDTSIFCPADKKPVRDTLGLGTEVPILLFAANGIRRNTWKDFDTLRLAIERVAFKLPNQQLLFIALGEQGETERLGQVEIRFIGYQADAHFVAKYYQAADIYVHAARADTFPNTVLEALCSGLPVVATSVGGIPEQIKSLDVRVASQIGKGGFASDDPTGILVPPSDADRMAQAILLLVEDKELRNTLSANAARDGRARFDLRDQAQAYLDWYEEILERERTKNRFSRASTESEIVHEMSNVKRTPAVTAH